MRLVTFVVLLSAMLFAGVGHAAATSKKKKAALRRLQDRGMTYVSFSSVASSLSASSNSLTISQGSTLTIGTGAVALNKTGSGVLEIGTANLGTVYVSIGSVAGQVGSSSGLPLLFNPISAGGTINSGATFTFPTGTGSGQLVLGGQSLINVGSGTLILSQNLTINGIAPTTVGGSGGN